MTRLHIFVFGFNQLIPAFLICMQLRYEKFMVKSVEEQSDKQPPDSNDQQPADSNQQPQQLQQQRSSTKEGKVSIHIFFLIKLRIGDEIMSILKRQGYVIWMIAA